MIEMVSWAFADEQTKPKQNSGVQMAKNPNLKCMIDYELGISEVTFLE